MRLRKITVKGLFGIFDHEIPMDKPERVTIIHGPNGYGKTMMLKMIAAAFNGDQTVFKHTPFNEFRMDFDDGSVWLVSRRMEETTAGRGDNEPIIEVTTTDSQRMATRVKFESDVDIPRTILDRMDQRVPGPYRRYRTGWRNDETGRVYSAAEILSMFPEATAGIPREFVEKFFRQSWGVEGQRVFVVEANRLDARAGVDNPRMLSRRFAHPVPDDEEIPPLRVKQYSLDVVQRIKSVLAEYAKSAQERDRTFPERLVQFAREGQPAFEERKILEQMSALEKKRKRLIELGFLDSETGLSDLTEADIRKSREALTIYVEDVQAKLKAFDEMAERIGKLKDIVNDRFDYKELMIHRELGFVLVSGQGEPIQLEDLSSGEQNELVLLYELLFQTPANGLILVDEPEISLHAAWQSRFLADLIEILKLNDAYAVVATHSPMIIGNQWGLTEQLKGPEKLQAVELQQ